MNGEFDRIARLLAGLPAGERVIVGAGDDAAVLRVEAAYDLVATTDAFVEGRHYRMDLVDAGTLGRRLAAANLSDVAAMGARPRWALLSLVLPLALDPRFVEEAARACAAALAADGAAIVGGNLAATDGPAVWNVTLLGEVERGRAWTRAGAHPGDAIAVTGNPGRAAAVLAALGAGVSWGRVPEALRAHWSAPPSRVAAARAMAAAGGVAACIDISDGFAADLAHLARASGVDVELDDATWPADPLQGDPALEPRLAPGDDYELILAIAPARLEGLVAAASTAGVPLHVVGRCAGAGTGRIMRRAVDGSLAEVTARGWDHFTG